MKHPYSWLSSFNEGGNIQVLYYSYSILAKHYLTCIGQVLCSFSRFFLSVILCLFPFRPSVANLLPEFFNVSGSHLFNTAPATSGRNSNRSFIPIPAARRCSVRIDGLAFPLSSLLISPCAIPVRSDNSFCVNPDCCRASMMACMIACSGWRASYSFLNSGS